MVPGSHCLYEHKGHQLSLFMHVIGGSLGAETPCYPLVPDRSILNGCIREGEGRKQTETMKSGTSDMYVCLKLQGTFTTLEQM